MSLSHLSDDLTHILADLFSRFKPNERSPRLFVLGCSTSTIIGETIGQQTSLAIGQQIVQTTHILSRTQYCLSRPMLRTLEPCARRGSNRCRTIQLTVC